MKELTQKRTAVFEQARAILLKAEKESRSLTSDERLKYERGMGDVVALGATIELLQQSGELGRSLGAAALRGGFTEADVSLERFIRGGRAELTQEQRGRFSMSAASNADIVNIRAASPLSASTAGAGTETVPQGFVYALETAKAWIGGVRQSRAKVIRTPLANAMPYPTANDSINEGIEVPESSGTVQADTEASFGSVVFKGTRYSSRPVLVPYELIQDSGLDVVSVLAEMLGERLGRIENRRFTSGTGTGQPKGIITAATSGLTTASATAITYDELVDLENSVDAAYRAGAEWMFNDSTSQFLRKMKDGGGRPVLNDSFAAFAASIKPGDVGSPIRYTLNGYPVILNSHMDGLTASKKSVLFGDMSKYIIREGGGVTLIRYGEKYMINGQVGFECIERVDGNLVNAGTNPVKYATQHA